jgi:hypothetical protein
MPWNPESHEEYPLSLSGEFPICMTQSVKHDITFVERSAMISNTQNITGRNPMRTSKSATPAYVEMLMRRMINRYAVRIAFRHDIPVLIYKLLVRPLSLIFYRVKPYFFIFFHSRFYSLNQYMTIHLALLVSI